jgi:hypothetical protein
MFAWAAEINLGPADVQHTLSPVAMEHYCVAAEEAQKRVLMV